MDNFCEKCGQDFDCAERLAKEQGKDRRLIFGIVVTLGSIAIGGLIGLALALKELISAIAQGLGG